MKVEGVTFNERLVRKMKRRSLLIYIKRSFSLTVLPRIGKVCFLIYMTGYVMPPLAAGMWILFCNMFVRGVHSPLNYY